MKNNNKYKPLPAKPLLHGPPPWPVIQGRLLEIARYWEESGISYPIYCSAENNEKTKSVPKKEIKKILEEDL